MQRATKDAWPDDDTPALAGMMTDSTWSARDDTEYQAGWRLFTAAVIVRMHVIDEAEKFRDGALAASRDAGEGRIRDLAEQAAVACGTFLDRWGTSQDRDPLAAYDDYQAVEEVAGRIRAELEPVFYPDQAAYLQKRYGVSLAEATFEQRHEATLAMMRTMQPPRSPEEREIARQLYEQLGWTNAVIDIALSDDDLRPRGWSWWAILQRLGGRRSRPGRHDPR